MRSSAYLTKKLSRSQARWDTNMAAVSLRSDYSRHVCAPYLGVNPQFDYE